MNTITLYTGNGVSLSPNPTGRTESDYVRLIADDGKMLTNGFDSAYCIDVNKSNVSEWIEVSDDTDEGATESDYITALNTLGVTTNEEN